MLLVFPGFEMRARTSRAKVALAGASVRGRESPRIQTARASKNTPGTPPLPTMARGVIRLSEQGRLKTEQATWSATLGSLRDHLSLARDGFQKASSINNETIIISSGHTVFAIFNQWPRPSTAWP